ncbi:hypothetical protein PR048_022482 [Dryococelus australis]|uniref:Transmembrane protein 188 n=1 Tax=Dryococelus australis TaxID=614101 RepID=A0ABQ9H179_9NEOP|nr:hypothetical protein PR048_022482 [Dryococelus australis]
MEWFERLNHTLEPYLWIFVADNKERLGFRGAIVSSLTYRSAVHGLTSITPSRMFFGRATPPQIKTLYNRRMSGEVFQEVTLLWLYNPKLQKCWKCPYMILKKINDVFWICCQGSRAKQKVVHIDQLATYECPDIREWDMTRVMGPVSVAVILFTLGIHKRVIAPSIIASRARAVLGDFNMSCDDTGKLILKPRPTAS